MTNINKKYRKDRTTPRKSVDISEFTYIGSLIKAMSTNLEDRYPDDSDGRVLFDAIRKGKQHLVRFILEAAPGNIVNARDFNGKTALIVVCSIKEEFRRTSVTRLLLYHGADINLSDDHHRTPLSHACEKRCNDLVDIFVKQSDVDPELHDDKGNSPLMYCAMVGNDIGVNTLMRHFRRLGLKVDAVNRDGYTPMLVAAKHGYISCARILFQQGQASLIAKDPVSNKTVEELLEKNGFTLEDLLPYQKQLHAKKRFQKIIHFARFTKSLKASMKSETRRSNYPRGSISASTDIYDKDFFPKGHPRAYHKPAILPPIQDSNQTKSGKREVKSSRKTVPHDKRNGSAVMPAINCRRRQRREFHNVGTNADNKYNDESSLSSDDTYEEDFPEDDFPEDDFNGMYSDMGSAYTDEEFM